MRQIVSFALLTFGLIGLLGLARCGGNPEVVRQPSAGCPLATASDAGDGLDDAARAAQLSESVVLVVMRLAQEVERTATDPETADAGAALPVERVCGAEGCRVRPADAGPPARRLERLERLP